VHGSTVGRRAHVCLSPGAQRVAAIAVRSGSDDQSGLPAIGHDWCRWRRSASYGSIPDEDFFGELLIDPPDGERLRKAAEKHLCPA